MDKKAAIKAYAIVAILLVSVSGVALAPFLASAVYSNPSGDNNSVTTECYDRQGTSLSAYKTATGYCEQEVCYNWTIDKSVNPDKAEIDEGKTATFQYTLTINRNEVSNVKECGVRGYIWVKNTGEHATVNLKIVDWVQTKVGSGTFKNYVKIDVDTSAKPVLQPGEEHKYYYDVSFAPVQGALYRNSALVTITNHGNNMGCPTGPNPKADFQLPASPCVEYCDESATVVDTLTVPDHYELFSTDAPAEWKMTGSGVLMFNVTIKNVDAEDGSVAFMDNVAKLTEDDSKVCREDNARVTLTGGDEYIPPVPGISVDKESNGCVMPGQVITWTITIKNTGNVALDTVYVEDYLIDFKDTISLPVGGEKVYTKSYQVPLSYTGKYVVNVVNVTAELEEDDLFVQDSSSVPVCYPCLEVTKVANSSMTAPGHYANWTITVKNSGDVDMYHVAVYDDMFVVNPMYVDVMAGQSVMIYVSTTIPADSILNEICNSVEAKWFYEIPADDDGKEKIWFVDDAKSCIPVIRPGIEITKEANMTWACVGDEIGYTIVVKNTGNYDLDGIHVVDVMLGIDEYINLEAGESKTFTDSYIVKQGDQKIENNATVCVDVFGDKHCVLEDYSIACVNVGYPAVSVYKVGPSEGLYPGDEFTYTIYVENTGDVPLKGVKVVDSLIGLEEEINLAVGENKSISVDWQIPDDYLRDEYCNQVFVEGSWCHCIVKDDSEWCIPVLHMPGQPCISIEKHGPCRAMVGETVPYFIVVKNTGGVPLSNVKLSDDVGADGVDVEWFYYDGTLMPGAYWNITTSATIPMDFKGPYFVNVVEVFGQYDGKNVWCIDSHAIDIIHPCFTIEKSAPKLSALGHVISYTLWVNNTGDVDLINIVILDEKAPDGKFTIDYLAMGASATLTYEWNVPMDYQSDEVCNDACGSAYPGPSAYWCGCGESCPWFEETNCGREVKKESNTVCTFIVKPAIDVEKSGPEMAKIGQTIQYNITVKNTGNYVIENVTVTDERLGFSAEVTLGPGESKTYLIDWLVTEEWVLLYIDDDYNVCNKANATADTFDDKHCVVYDEDVWCVFIGAPSIDIIKKGPAEAFPGEVIQFNFTVTNNGNLPLFNVNVTDPLLGANWYHYIGYMAVGAVVQFNASYTVPNPFEGNSFKNVAKVTGDDVTDTTVNDTDNTTVFVAHPKIEVYKSWDSPMTALGHYVNWSIEVKNTGNVNLTGVYVWDPLTGESWNVGMLNKSESKFLTAHYLVTKDSRWDEKFMLCNTVYADGFYKTVKVSDSDEDCVFVALPSFEVTKCGPEYVCYGDCIVWTITVKNTGNVDLKNVTITDPLTGDEWKNVCIEVGKQWSKTVSYDTDGAKAALCEVPSDTVCNTIYVVADTFDNGHCILEGKAESCVFVAKPDVEVEKSGPKVAVGGEKITYTITIKNVGNVDLNVRLTDALLKVDETVFVAKGATVVKTYDYCVPLCSAGSIIDNTVIVNGTWTVCNKCYDIDSACWSVEVKDLSINILKTGPESAQVGETITFTFDVWNDGEVPLESVHVYDPLFEEYDLEAYFYLADDQNQDDVLDVGEHWVFSVQFTIPADYLDGDACGQLNNYACAHGSYHGVSTTWGDGWAVYVYDPACPLPKPT